MVLRGGFLKVFQAIVTTAPLRFRAVKQKDVELLQPHMRCVGQYANRFAQFLPQSRLGLFCDRGRISEQLIFDLDRPVSGAGRCIFARRIFVVNCRLGRRKWGLYFLRGYRGDPAADRQPSGNDATRTTKMRWPNSHLSSLENLTLLYSTISPPAR